MDNQTAIEWLNSPHVTQTLHKHRLEELQELLDAQHKLKELLYTGIFTDEFDRAAKQELLFLEARVSAKKKAIMNSSVREVENVSS